MLLLFIQYFISANEFDDGAGPSAVRGEQHSSEEIEYLEDIEMPPDENNETVTAIETPSKRKRPNRSYGAALQDFSEDFMNRYKEANNHFLEGMKELQVQQQEFDQKCMEEDRDFLKKLFEKI